MKNIWLNILAFVAFLAIEITAVSFMSTYFAGSTAMVLLGVLALVIGGVYTAETLPASSAEPILSLLSSIHFCFFLQGSRE